MGVMKKLSELEQELYNKGVLRLKKNDLITDKALCWFNNTQDLENYTGIFKGIKLDIQETDSEIIIIYNK